MPLDFEEKTDISGDPNPASPLTKHQMAGAMKAQVNQTRRGPRVPEPSPSPGKEQAQHGKDERGGEGASSGDGKPPTPPQARPAATPEPPPPQGNPVLPIDWKAKQQENAWATHQHGRHVASILDSLTNPAYWQGLGSATEGAKLPYEAFQQVGDVWNAADDPNAVGQSVHNIWNQNTAQSTVAKWTLEGAVQALPPAQLARQLDQSLTGASADQATQDVISQGLPMTANPLNAIAPEKILPQMALYASPYIAQALASTNPDERSSALTWAMVTGGILSAGHLGALRPLLSDLLGKYPELETVLDRVVNNKKSYQTKIQDPQQDHRLDAIQEALKNPVYKGGVTQAKKAGGDEQTIKRTVDERGQIIERNVTAERTRAALKAAGVESRGELEQAIAGGRLPSGTADAILQNWQEMGFRYDLNYVTRADSPLRDPATILRAASPQVRATGTRALTAANAYIEQMQRSHLVNDANPLVSTWRSLIGLSRGTDAIDREGTAALLDLAGHVDGNLLSQAIEGDRAVYEGLPDEGKAYVDIWRVVSNEERLARQRAGIPFAVGDYLWRVTKKAKKAAPGGGGGGMLTSEAERHRVLAPKLDEEGHVILTQAYEKVADSNAAIARARQGALGHLTDWATPLSKDFANDPEAQAIRQLAGQDIGAATKRAQDYVNGLYRDFETNSHRILARGGFGRQIKAIQTLRAVNDLTDMKLKVPNPEGGEDLVVNAAYRVGQDPRHDELMRAAGYQALEQSRFRDVLVHPQLAKLIDRATAHARYAATQVELRSLKQVVRDPLGSVKAAGESLGAEPVKSIKATALAFETAALRLIMYQPAVHGWNVAGRFLAFAGMHAASDPIGLVSHLFGGDVQGMRTEAINAGVILHGRQANFLPEVYKQLGDALGEHDLFELPVDAEQVAGHSPEVANLAGLGRPKMNFFQRAQNLLWSKVDDFAIAAYHIEKHSALASGLSPEEASLWAARRANSWAGYVASEDTNPLLHDGARLLMFAPSFWRTWGELFVPIYRNSGVAMTPRLAVHIAKQELALVASTVAVSYVTGNLLNMMASGQMQDHNEPQNRMKVEVRRPAVIRALQAVNYPGASKIDAATGYGPNGEVLSLDNPLARFQKDVAQGSGLVSGHKDYQPGDTTDGLLQFGVNRLSPLIETAAGMMNVDLYSTVKDHQLRSVDKSAPGLHPTPESILAGLLYSTPGGSNLIRQITSNQKNPQGLTLPGGAQVPPGVVKVGEGIKQTSEGLLWQALTGTNGPYTTAERTRGQTPSDDEYNKYNQIKTTYEGQMGALDAEVAGGSITPNQWLTQYRKAHSIYVDSSSSFFMNAPEYAHGPTALTSDWEGLYKKAENPDGTLDAAKLASRQAEWKTKHSPADYAAVQGQLSKSDQKYPMLGLYHKTINGYLKWQESWASQHGYDVNAIRSEAKEYGVLYGDSKASAAYLRQHRDLAAYEKAKKSQFETSPLGLMYGLYYDSTVVATYMRAHHLTTQRVEQEAESAA